MDKINVTAYTCRICQKMFIDSFQLHVGILLGFIVVKFVIDSIFSFFFQLKDTSTQRAQRWNGSSSDFLDIFSAYNRIVLKVNSETHGIFITFGEMFLHNLNELEDSLHSMSQEMLQKKIVLKVSCNRSLRFGFYFLD